MEPTRSTDERNGADPSTPPTDRTDESTRRRPGHRTETGTETTRGSGRAASLRDRLTGGRSADDGPATGETDRHDQPATGRPGRAAARRERLTGRPAPDGPRPGIRDRIAADRPGTSRPRPAPADSPGGRPVVTEDDLVVMTGGEDLGVYRARRRFGGFDLGATLAGLLAAVGMTALIGGLAGAIGTIGYQMDVERDRQVLSAGGFVAGLVILVLSFLVGGWVAGRVGRYDGGTNGVGAGVLFLMLSAVLAGLGAWLGDEYDVLTQISVPQWFTGDTSTVAAVVSAVAGVIVMIGAGWLGGVVGSRYHRRADAYLAEYAQGGRPVTADALMDDSRHRRSLLHR